MPDTSLPFTNGFYKSGSWPLSKQECTNWFPVQPEESSLSNAVLFGTPGLTQRVAGLGVREVNRGSFVMDKIGYFVNGTRLYRLDHTVVGTAETFGVTDLGAIEGTARVSMATNGTQLCILVPGGKGYIYTVSGGLVEITDSDFRASGDPQYVEYADGYFIFTLDAKKWIVSELNDGLAYNALDFGSAEADPDDVVAPVVLNNQVFIAGSQTIEAFQNIGGSAFPFQRTGLFIPKGVLAPSSLVKTGNSFMFIGGGKDEGPAVWAVEGNAPAKVSTDAIDTLLASYTAADLAGSFAWYLKDQNSAFVAFNLPTTTVVYDLKTGKWHERKSQVPNLKGIPETVRCRVNSLVVISQRVYVGDSQDGRIGEMSLTTFKEYGYPMIRRFVTQPFQNNLNPFFLPSIELVVEAGVGNDECPDPRIGMQMSVDGGRTWSMMRYRHIGKRGQYKKRAIWRRLGRVPATTMFAFEMSDAVKATALQLTADMV